MYGHGYGPGWYKDPTPMIQVTMTGHTVGGVPTKIILGFVIIAITTQPQLGCQEAGISTVSLYFCE